MSLGGIEVTYFTKIVPHCTEEHGPFDNTLEYNISHVTNFSVCENRNLCDVYWHDSHEIVDGFRCVVSWKPQLQVLAKEWVIPKYMYVSK